MATNYSPTIVTDGAVFVGDALMPSISEPGTRLYNRAGINSADVKLLIHGNVGTGQTFVDSSLSNHTITANGDVTHSSTQSKFSGSSIYFDGTSDYLDVAASTGFAFGTGDFTVDVFVYTDNTTADSFYRRIYMTDGPTGNDATNPQLAIVPTTGLANAWSTSGSLDLSSTTNVADGAWHHIAMVRSSGTVTLYVDGVSEATASWTENVALNSGSPRPRIGSYDGSTGDFDGYIDEIRVTAGVALWTKDFTPPARRDTLSISDGMMYNANCVDFDGTNDYVNIPSSSDFDLTGNFTWSFWANADNTTHQGMPIGRGAWAETGFWGIRIDSPTWELQVDWDGVTGADYWLTSATLDAGVWTHITVTFDGTAAKIYKNGALVDSQATTTAPGSGSEPVTIGDRDGSGAPFNGKIADVRIYNVALSVNNVKEIYDDSKVIIPSNVLQTNLKGWWPLTEGAGDICYDGSGNGNNGTFENEDGDEWLTGQTGAPQLVEGYNRPMLFDADGYVDMALTLDAVTDYTFSWWSRHTSQNNPDLFTSGGSSTGAFNLNWAGSTDRPILYLAGSNYAYFSDNAAQDDGQWHHWLLTYNGTATSGREAIDSKLYIDGVDQSITSAAYTAAPTTWGTFRIGRAGSGGTFSGDLNEFIIYNGQLGSSDRAALYVRGPNGGPLPPDPMSLSNSSDVLAYWRNDGGVTWTDRSGNGYTGTVSGSPDTLLFKQGINGSASTSTGRDGQGFPLKFKNVGAVGFNGISDYVAFTSRVLAGGFTISMWINPHDVTSKNLLGLSSASSDYVWITSSSEVDLRSSDMALTFTDSNITAGVWQYICITRDGSGIPKFYRDSLLIQTLAADAGTFTFDQIGRYHDGSTGSAGDFFFNGQIANLQVYNRALSYAEIQQNYNAQRSRFT